MKLNLYLAINKAKESGMREMEKFCGIFKRLFCVFGLVMFIFIELVESGEKERYVGKLEVMFWICYVCDDYENFKERCEIGRYELGF